MYRENRTYYMMISCHIPVGLGSNQYVSTGLGSV